jgi:hypothetical protein
MAKKYSSRLKTMADIRRFLARKLNEFDMGELEADALRCMAYTCQILKSIISEGDIEARLEALEQAEKERAADIPRLRRA